MKQVRYDQPMLRDLYASGFNENRQGVTLSGRTWDREVLVVIYLKAIKVVFPKIASIVQCVSFVERNLEPFRGLVKGKLIAGTATEFQVDPGWTETALLVEIDVSDLTRSKRWLTP